MCQLHLAQHGGALLLRNPKQTSARSKITMSKPMATWSMCGCSILRSAAYPPVRLFLSRRLYHFRSSFARATPKLPVSHPVFPTNLLSPRINGSYSTFHANNLLSLVMEELNDMRSRRRARSTNKVEFPSSDESLKVKHSKRSLQKGCLLEFKKDSQKLLLAVAQKPDGKKNWTVCDQNGVFSSIKPQQVTYIVPGIENFDHTDIPVFFQKAQSLLDQTILEFAWGELLENNRSVTPEELAEMIFGSSEPLESYCAHLLLSNDEIYFIQVEHKGSSFVYEPRPIVQVEELIHRKNLEEVSKKEEEEFIKLLISAKTLPPGSKPSKSSWLKEEKFRQWIKSLEAYAIDACKDNDQSKIAGNFLKGMGLSKTSSAAVNLLIQIGYFPVHVNLDILKLNVCSEHSEGVLLDVEDLFMTSTDLDEVGRKDLSSLKVYAIDVNDADELDDALSATKLPDGRIKVWVHVADPASLIKPRSQIDREAMRRGTSIFLPTTTIPMFPEKLAMEAMSLQQGKLCKAISVCITLQHDGSIADYAIENSIIRPTYMLTYESASELLHLGLEEEVELQILSEAASLRLQWRQNQGAIDMAMIEPRVKVINPDDPEPSINLYVEDQSDPAMRLVSEMMILCGEVIATFGSANNIYLPYRGQTQSSVSVSAFDYLPEGPVRSSAFVRVMRAAEMEFKKPIRHAVLGVPGYVQFTSPIRRYVDLLAHYQIKAFLRGEPLPFSLGELEGIACLVNLHVRVAKKLQSSSLRYWLLEYFRRQPRERKFCALILRFIKDRLATLLLVEVGMQASASVSSGKQIGDMIKVIVEEAHPRDDVFLVREV